MIKEVLCTDMSQCPNTLEGAEIPDRGPGALPVNATIGRLWFCGMSDHSSLRRSLGLIHPSCRPSAPGQPPAVFGVPNTVLVLVTAAICAFCLIPDASPEHALWLGVGGGALLVPALWFTLRHPRAIWQHLRSIFSRAPSDELRKLYGRAPTRAAKRVTPSAVS